MLALEHLTERQWDRLDDCLDRGDPDGEVFLLGVLSTVCAAYAGPDPATGKTITATFASFPIRDIARLGRTLRQWKTTYLIYMTTDRSSNGATEATKTAPPHRPPFPQPRPVLPTRAPGRRRTRHHTRTRSPIRASTFGISRHRAATCAAAMGFYSTDPADPPNCS